MSKGEDGAYRTPGAAQPVLSVPAQVAGVGPKGLLLGQVDSFPLEGRQQHRGRAHLLEACRRKQDSMVVSQGPQPLIEGPMGILGQRQPVAGIVVSAVGERMDMRRIDDAAGLGCHQLVARQGARVVVGRNNRETESSLANDSVRRLVGDDGVVHPVGFIQRDVGKLRQGRPLRRVREVAVDEEKAKAMAKTRVQQAVEEFRVNLRHRGPASLVRGNSIRIQGNPDPRRLEMIERQPNLGSLVATGCHDGPQRQKPKREIAGERQSWFRQDACLDHFDDGQKQERLVGRRTPLLIDP